MCKNLRKILSRWGKVYTWRRTTWNTTYRTTYKDRDYKNKGGREAVKDYSFMDGTLLESSLSFVKFWNRIFV